MTSGPHRFPANGCWLEFFDPLIAELAGQAGYDYTMIDMEHGPGTLESLLRVVQASQLGGAKALVRIPEKDPRWIGRIMDLGADGAMVPMVNDAADAQSMARGCLYPPGGTRGVATPVIRASRYGADVGGYLRSYRDNFLLMVQIETAGAARNAEQIAAVEGIDAVFIGPFDLSASLGFPGQPDHPQVHECIAAIAANVLREGKTLAGLPTPEVSVESLFTQGFDFVLGGMDMLLLREAMYADVERHRAACKAKT